MKERTEAAGPDGYTFTKPEGLLAHYTKASTAFEHILPGKLRLSPYRLMRDPAVVFQMLVTRSVDSFLTYIADLLALLFRTRPEMLRSAEQVRTEFILRFDSMDDLVEALAERRVERLSYAGMDDLTTNLSESVGFDLFPDAADLARAARIVEDRNLIVHNRAVVNRRYLSKVAEATTALGDRLELDFEPVFADLSFLTERATDIDARAAAKWSIAQSPTADLLHARSSLSR